MFLQKITVEQILSNLGIKELNEMQQAALEAAGTDGDMVLLSPTGSGKTLAFLLPMLQRIEERKGCTEALIVVPSRELVQQIESVFRAMKTGLKVTVCYGGHIRETEENNLVQPPTVIIGTPGRLADHLRRGNITATTITTLVLDEFDKTLELGFDEEMAFIIEQLPGINKRILTSATEAVEIPEFAGVTNETRLSFLTGEELPKEKLAIKTVLSPEKDKADTLFQLVCHLGGRPTIVFCNHREAVERTGTLLKDKGIPNTWYHGGMEQQERDNALAKFRNGTVNVLVTTDLAARGLDIPHIRYIIHYHLPDTEDSFTHRNGRTARMDATGTAILLIGPEESMPDYVTADAEEIVLDDTYPLPDAPKWTTLFIAAGKKDKVNKVDIVGFLSHKGGLKKEDIGLIDVKDKFSYVAIRKSRASHTLHLIKEQKIKNKKVTIAVAR